MLALSTVHLAEAASEHVFDRIVAVVDHDPILLSEVVARAKPSLKKLDEQPEAQRAAARSQVMREMLDRMIDEELERREADKRHMLVSETEIDKGIEQVAAQNGMKMDALAEAIEHEGMTMPEYRALLRIQILEAKLLTAVVPRTKLVPGDAEVESRFEDLKKKVSEVTRDQAKEMLMRERMEKAQKDWIARLRKDTFIEVRL